MTELISLHSDPSSESAVDRAYRTLRGQILSGELPVGTMLGEASIATVLGVSRTPVRTALSRLQEEGWITVYPKRGALVRGLTERARGELADARLILESGAVSRATAETRAALGPHLMASISRQRAALQSGDVATFIELTVAFHRGFLEAGGNHIVLELGDRLADRQRFVLFSQGQTLLERCEDIIAEHERLVTLLIEEDSSGFAELLRSHISDTSKVGLAAV